MGLSEDYHKEIRRSYGLLFPTTKSQRIIPNSNHNHNHATALDLEQAANLAA